MQTKTLKTAIRELEKLAKELNEDQAEKLYKTIDKLYAELYKGISIWHSKECYFYVYNCLNNV